jgi:uncharacterized membrane protein YqjE
MNEILKIIPILLYMIVGAISMVMAVKNLFSNKFLPFHEKAANKRWDEIDNSLRLVILALLRLAGLGFLIISILLLVFPIINYFIPNKFYQYSIPIIALIYCIGLFVINYSLYMKTKANTPWRGSLYAMLAIITGIITSILS